MNFNLKIYKQLKIKSYFKTTNFFFFFQGISSNNKNWIKIEQSFINYDLEYYRIFNTLLINILKNSLFKNLTVLIHGPIILITIKNSKITLNKLSSFHSLIYLLCLKLNNKIYSNKQIKNLKNFSYIENVYFFYKSLNSFLKIPYYKVKSSK